MIDPQSGSVTDLGFDVTRYQELFGGVRAFSAVGVGADLAVAGLTLDQRIEVVRLAQSGGTTELFSATVPPSLTLAPSVAVAANRLVTFDAVDGTGLLELSAAADTVGIAGARVLFNERGGSTAANAAIAVQADGTERSSLTDALWAGADVDNSVQTEQLGGELFLLDGVAVDGTAAGASLHHFDPNADELGLRLGIVPLDVIHLLVWPAVGAEHLAVGVRASGPATGATDLFYLDERIADSLERITNDPGLEVPLAVGP